MRTNQVVLNTVSLVVSFMKTHLLQAAKLTAKSFFHPRSDPGIIGNRAIFRLFNTLIFLNTEEMCSKPSKTKKKNFDHHSVCLGSQKALYFRLEKQSL